MKAIILAAGRGTRMAPLTDTLPKPMLKVLDKNLIEWKLEALPEGVEEIILVVGYLQEKIRKYFGTSWKNIPIRYIEHPALDGTGGAIELCKDIITDKALVMMGDDIYDAEDLQKLSQYPFSILVIDAGEDAKNSKAAKVIEKDGLFVGLNEGFAQTGIDSTLLNAGAYTISKEYFSYEKQKVSEKEYGLPQTLVLLAKDHPVQVVRTKKWIQITTPECLNNASFILNPQQKKEL